jgi:hypothetical protein
MCCWMPFAQPVTHFATPAAAAATAGCCKRIRESALAPLKLHRLNKMQRHGRRIKRRVYDAHACANEMGEFHGPAAHSLTHKHTHVCAAGKKRRWTRRALCGKWIRAINLGGCKPAVQLVRSADDGGHRSADRDTRVAIYYPAAVGP